MWLKASRLAM